MEKIKVLVIGDPHNKPSYVSETPALANKICATIDAEGPNLCVILGDLHDTHDRVSTQVLNRHYYFLSSISSKITTIYIIGNHDLINNSQFCSKEHPFNTFKNINNLSIIDEPRVMDFGGYRFLFCPYAPPGRFSEMVGDMYKGVQAVFCHQEFGGAPMGPVTSRSPDSWPLDRPLLISGHIHQRVVMQQNLIYVGSPMAHDYGDTAEKTISVFEFRTDGVSEKLIDLGFPKKMTLRINVNDVATLSCEKFGNASLKIIIEGSVAELEAIKKSNKFIELSKKYKVIIRPIVVAAKPKNPKMVGFLNLLREAVSSEPDSVRVVLKEILDET